MNFCYAYSPDIGELLSGCSDWLRFAWVFGFAARQRRRPACVRKFVRKELQSAGQSSTMRTHSRRVSYGTRSHLLTRPIRSVLLDQPERVFSLSPAVDFYGFLFELLVDLKEVLQFFQSVVVELG